MNNRERTHAVLNYEKYDRMPAVHFGFWKETHEKWFEEGFISEEEFNMREPERERHIAEKLGFDFGWGGTFGTHSGLLPAFEEKVIEELPGGSRKIRNSSGVIVLQHPDANSIPAEFDHLLKDRKSWEENFLPRLQFEEKRIDYELMSRKKTESEKAENPVIMGVGSMIGVIRNWLGVEGLSYLWADDPELFDEIINTCAELSYKCVEKALSCGVKIDFANLWEDICFKNGPLVAPSVFKEKCGPHYKKLTTLLNRHGIKFISVDCDGCIDSLISTWLENGVNTMFPIEVGTWNASIKPWREKYGSEIRGVGGMNKCVFAYDRKAVDLEIERLKALVALGGYIPCPDHRIAPDAKWDNVCYYCESIRKTF